MAQPTITLHTLHAADGSATYISPSNGLHVTSGINYPLEVSYRSKEIPEDTYIEVNLRPNNAVAGVKERHVEHVVARILKSVVRGEETPRCMLQVTLQVTNADTDESLPGGVKEGQGGSYLEVLAAGINAAVAGCLDGTVQMWGVAGAVLVGIVGERVVVWPNIQDRKKARSLHVFGYGREGECLVMESEGRFGVDEWEEAERAAKASVLGGEGDDEDMDVDVDEDVDGEKPESLLSVIRRAVEAKVQKDSKWRGES